MKTIRLAVVAVMLLAITIMPALTVTSQAPAPRAATLDMNLLKAKNKRLQTIVYITETGSKYHRGGCRSLRKSKIRITLKEAKNQGYTPCKICRPPQ